MTDDLFPQETRRSLPIALLRAREAIMQHFRPMLAAQHLTEQQWRVMRILAERGTLDATDLATAAHVLGPSLTRMLDALESRQLIHRLREASDRRRTRISLTSDGKEIIKKVLPDRAAIYQRIETKYGKEKIRQLLDLLEEFDDKMG